MGQYPGPSDCSNGEAGIRAEVVNSGTKNVKKSREIPMARKRKASQLEDMLDLVSLMPWWAGVAIAAIG